MREPRAGPAHMRLLVVAHEVDVHDGQAARHIDRTANREEFAQPDADKHARNQQQEFAPRTPAAQDGAHEVDEADRGLDGQQPGDPDRRGEVQHDEDENVSNLLRAPHVAEPDACRAEVALMLARPTRINVRPRTAAAQQTLGLFRAGRLARLGPVRIPHPAEFLHRAIEKAEGRHRRANAVIQFGLHRRRRRGQPGIKRVQLVAFAPQQPAQERHGVRRNRALELSAAQTVNLDQQQPRRLRGALGGRQPEVPHRPFAAAQPASHPVQSRFNLGEHGNRGGRDQGTKGLKDQGTKRPA